MKTIYDSGRNYEWQCWAPVEIHDFNYNSPEISCKVSWYSNLNSMGFLWVGIFKFCKDSYMNSGFSMKVLEFESLVKNPGFIGNYRNRAGFMKFLLRMLDFNRRWEISARVLDIHLEYLASCKSSAIFDGSSVISVEIERSGFMRSVLRFRRDCWSCKEFSNSDNLGVLLGIL